MPGLRSENGEAMKGCGNREPIDLENQLPLFRQAETARDQSEPDTLDKLKPGAVWNGKIWVSDDDVGF